MAARSEHQRMDELLMLELESQLPEFLYFWGHNPTSNRPVGSWIESCRVHAAFAAIRERPDSTGDTTN